MTYPTLIASESFPADRGTDPFSVVLRDMGPESAHRYVTHCRNDRDASHFWGHYFSDEMTARKDFMTRCRKYYRS